jgi:Integrase zinc binding domain
LSQPPGAEEGKHDNKDVLVLPQKLFMRAAEVLALEQQVWDDQGHHPEHFQELWKSHPIEFVNHHWLHQGQPVVVLHDLQQQILQNYHDHALAGHPGIATMLQMVAKDYWWPDMKQFVQSYVKGCVTCQMTELNTVQPRALLLPITVALKAIPFQTISLDLITNLPVSKGYDSILTIINHDCSKAAVFLPCQKTIDAEGIA